MSVRAQAPEEDAETRRRREIEQGRADATRIEETQEDLSREGEQVARQFGRRSAASGISPLGTVNPVVGQRANFATAFARALSGIGSLSQTSLR